MTKDQLIKLLQESDMDGSDPVFVDVDGPVSIDYVEDAQNCVIIYLK